MSDPAQTTESCKALTLSDLTVGGATGFTAERTAALRRALTELRAHAECGLADAQDWLQAARMARHGSSTRLAEEDVAAYRAQLELLALTERVLEAGAAAGGGDQPSAVGPPAVLPRAGMPPGDAGRPVQGQGGDGTGNGPSTAPRRPKEPLAPAGRRTSAKEALAVLRTAERGEGEAR